MGGFLLLMFTLTPILIACQLDAFRTWVSQHQMMIVHETTTATQIVTTTATPAAAHLQPRTAQVTQLPANTTTEEQASTVTSETSTTEPASTTGLLVMTLRTLTRSRCTTTGPNSGGRTRMKPVERRAAAQEADVVTTVTETESSVTRPSICYINGSPTKSEGLVARRTADAVVPVSEEESSTATLHYATTKCYINGNPATSETFVARRTAAAVTPVSGEESSTATPHYGTTKCYINGNPTTSDSLIARRTTAPQARRKTQTRPFMCEGLQESRRCTNAVRFIVRKYHRNDTELNHAVNQLYAYNAAFLWQFLFPGRASATDGYDMLLRDEFQDIDVCGQQKSADLVGSWCETLIWLHWWRRDRDLALLGKAEASCQTPGTCEALLRENACKDGVMDSDVALAMDLVTLVRDYDGAFYHEHEPARGVGKNRWGGRLALPQHGCDLVDFENDRYKSFSFCEGRAGVFCADAIQFYKSQLPGSAQTLPQVTSTQAPSVTAT